MTQEYEYDFPYHYIPQYTHNNFTQTFNWVWGKNYLSTIELLISKLNQLQFDSICDIGTGDGRFVRELSRNFNGKKIVGIDYSHKAIALAKAMNPSANFIVANILDNEIIEEFDVLTVIEVFEHIQPKLANQFISALHDITAQNGYLLLTVPHINKPLQKKHFRHFTRQELESEFNNHFQIEELIYFEKRSKSFKYKLLNKLLCNQYFILNHQKLKNYIYLQYKRKYFFANENNCGRIFVQMKKI